MSRSGIRVTEVREEVGGKDWKREDRFKAEEEVEVLEIGETVVEVGI